MNNTSTGISVCTQCACKLMLCVCIIIQSSWSVVASDEPVILPNSLHCEENSDCPTWFGCNNHTCVCNTEPEHIIKCDGKRSAVLACYCVTTDEDEFSSRGLIVGSCIFNCWRRPNHTILDSQYFILPRNSSSLNSDTCGWLKRTGPLCGKCLPNHSPTVYSYSLKCVECPHGHRNWGLFILIAFVPLTVFYIIILLLNVNVAASSLHAFVLFCQLVSSPPFARVIENSPNQSSATVVTKVFMSLYGIWNLDFFRFFLPNICLNTSPLLSLSLDYIVAIYPLFLVLVTYLLITLYDRNFKVLVFVCKPVKLCFSWFQERHRENTTIIDAFVTFFVLSFVKIISVSFDLLFPVPVYSFNSSEVSLALFYDGSIAYFGKEHLPFAIVAILFLVCFVVIPVVILLFYPYCWFQRLLSCLPSRWYLILQAFVDSSQGCYKNGTEEGSHDYRSFSGLYFILRIVGLLLYVFTLQSTFYILCGIVFLLFALLLLALRPYKLELSWYTNLHAAFLILLVMLWFSLTGLSYVPHKKTTFLTFTLLCWISPVIYSILCALRWLFYQRKITKKYISNISCWLRTHCCSANNVSVDSDESLPYRVTESYQHFTN